MEISRNPGKHVAIASGYQYKGYKRFYDECALSCSRPQPLYTINHSKEENCQNIDFSSLLRKSVRGKIREGNYRVHSVCFQPPSVAANQKK